MARIETWLEQDLNTPVKPYYLKGNVFNLDNVGNLIGVKVYNNGSSVTLSGSVTGYCVLADGTTVSVTGTRSGNSASITLPQSALSVPGMIGIAIKLIDGSTITTLAVVVATVYVSRTDTVITPSQQVITDWSNSINAALQNVENALSQMVKYVSARGSDGNNGDTAATPYATIGAAIASGARTIYVATGTYEETVSENTAYRYGSVKIIGNKVTMTGSSTLLHFRYCNVEISGFNFVIADSSSDTASCLHLLNCTGKVTDCTASGAPYMGFRLDGCLMTMERCTAHDCGTDGFNGHTVDTGYDCDITLIDCVAYDNADDGASVHEHGKLHVFGGEYYGNTSAGIAPAQWCDFEIHGAYVHGNGTGIEAINSSWTSGAKASGTIEGCVIDGNNKTGRSQSSYIGYGIIAGNYTVNILGNAITNNNSGTTKENSGGTINVLVDAKLGEDVTSLKNAISLEIAKSDVTTNARALYIPYSFINGKKYVIELAKSDETVSGIRVTSAANLNTESIVQGYAVNATTAKIKYECASNSAAYLVVYCASTVTEFTCSVFMYEDGIMGDIYDLENDVEELKTTKVEKYITPGYVDDSYVKTDGTFASYNGWSRTDFIDISKFTNVVIDIDRTGTTSYIYNALYSSNSESAFVEKMTLVNGSNNIKIPENVKYMVLSNTTNALKTTYKISGYIDASELVKNNEIIPSYSINYLNEKAFSIMNQIMNGSANSDVFAFITDTHFPANSGQSGKYMAYLLGKLPGKKAFFGGDVCPAYSSSYPNDNSEQACVQSVEDQFAAINEKLASYKLFQVKGNHDFHVSSQTVQSDKYMLNPQQARNVVMGGSELMDLVTDDSNLEAAYYYIDNESQNIRYIIMDACEFFGVGNEWVQNYGMSNTQINWIVNNAIKTALGRNFIFITHVGMVDMTSTDNTYQTFSKIENIIKALNAHTTYTASGATYDFTEATGRVMAVITGHEHQDLMTFVEGVPHISIACDAGYNDYKKSFLYSHFDAVPPTKTKGTVDEVTFDIVNVDSQAVRFNRIGGGGNRYFSTTKYTGSVGGTVTVTPTIGGTISWWCYDANGRAVDGNYVITPNTTRASVNSGGVVTCSASGEVVVVARNTDNVYEFFDLIVS